MQTTRSKRPQAPHPKPFKTTPNGADRPFWVAMSIRNFSEALSNCDETRFRCSRCSKFILCARCHAQVRCSPGSRCSQMSSENACYIVSPV